jgi:hypothetical protein
VGQLELIFDLREISGDNCVVFWSVLFCKYILS